MKTIKTKRGNLMYCWIGLRKVTPAKYPSIDEMEKSRIVLSAFEEAAGNVIKLVQEGEKLNMDIMSGKIEPKKAAKARGEFDKKTMASDNKGEYEEVISVELENEEFNTFFQQFSRWGKDWFMNVDYFLTFRKDMDITNQQSSKK